MKKLSCIIIIVLCAINCKAQSRDPADLGQGAVTIGLFWFPPADTGKMDTSGHKFIQYDYYIDHDKVLKKGNADVLIGNSNSKQIINDEDTLTNHLSASMISPTYIIDWKKKLVYTFYKKNNKNFIALDSLNKYTDDVFYRTISLKTNDSIRVVFDTLKQIKVQIAGLDCYQAQYKSTANKSWHRFIYTKKQLSFYPLLNCLFNSSFPYPILSFDCESNNDSYPDRQMHTAIMRLETTSVDEKKQPANLFLVPNDIPIQKNVSKREIYLNNTSK